MQTRVKVYLISGVAAVVLVLGAALAGFDVRLAAIGFIAVGLALFVVGLIGYVIDREKSVDEPRRGETEAGGATLWAGLAGQPSYITEDGSGTPTP